MRKAKLRPTPDVLAAITARLANGWTQAEIGAEFGASQITVSRFIKTYFELVPKDRKSRK